MGSLVRTLPAGPRHAQSPAEERANSLSHGLALVAALVGGPYLIVQAARRADAASVVGASTFFATIVILYLASALYVWGLALAGIVLKSVGKASHPIFSTGLYLKMGGLCRGVPGG